MSVANLDVIVTERKRTLQERIGILLPEQIREVDEAIRFALGMEE